ncbi:MAG: hypothetical protein HC941_30130 [Microcoleus sp. SU_5_3]|nr:hypothetical protein [Microcoleus sp. SU_5_3]NJL69693.1 hypothetical protein [Microcoleus sp. SM1_3_4]
MKTLLSVGQGTRTDSVNGTPRTFDAGILGSPIQVALGSLRNYVQKLHLPKRFTSCRITCVEASFPVSLGTANSSRDWLFVAEHFLRMLDATATFEGVL